MSKKKKTGNEAAMREVLERLDVLGLGALKFPLDGDSSEIYDADKKPITLPAWGIATLLNRAREIQVMARSVLAKPPRNCDKFRDVDEAYDQFMPYVRRENPTFTKASPLHTAWDALKWVLGGERKEADA